MEKRGLWAGRGSGCAALGCKVSAVARNNRSYIWGVFWRASGASSAGSVNTTWKYSHSKSSACRFSNHLALAKDWHFGQWRSAHVMEISPLRVLWGVISNGEFGLGIHAGLAFSTGLGRGALTPIPGAFSTLKHASIAQSHQE